MTALRQLLHDHAIAPTRPLDVEGLLLRARRHRRRRVAMWLGSLAAGAGALLVPGQAGWLTAATGGDDVQVVEPPTTTATPSPPETARPTAAPPTTAATGDTTGPAADPGGAAAPTEPESTSATPPAQERWEPFGPAPEHEGCAVYSRHPYNGGSPVVGPEQPADQVQSCSYLATRPGSYDGSGTWTLEIERDGTTITYDSLRNPPCGRDVIQPGDVVHARLGIDGSPVIASAGEGEWHLDVGSWVVC